MGTNLVMMDQYDSCLVVMISQAALLQAIEDTSTFCMDDIIQSTSRGKDITYHSRVGVYSVSTTTTNNFTPVYKLKYSKQ